MGDRVWVQFPVPDILYRNVTRIDDLTMSSNLRQITWKCVYLRSRDKDGSYLTIPSDVGSTATQNFIPRMLFPDMY